MFIPSYIKSYKEGLLLKRVKSACEMLGNCLICPRGCGVNRLQDEKGICKTGAKAVVCSYFLHHGEEPPISGYKGSGTIFFSNCNLKCLYCQNYKISQEDSEGRELENGELAELMLKLQKEGAHNINLVTPTHVMPQILAAILIATEGGLNIPIIYNTSGYDSIEGLKLLDGIIDIYLADMRYSDCAQSAKYSHAKDYPQINKIAVKEMYRQVGDLETDDNAVAEKGLIIRHLVLPNNISGSGDILSFIKRELSPDCAISLMSQYLPCYRAFEFPEINRRITYKEYQNAVEILDEMGFSSGWTQQLHDSEDFAGENIIKPNL